MSDISSVFKAYDIRGLAPGELDEAFAKRLGQVLAAEYRPARVMVGRDMRDLSPKLEAALVEGLTEMGTDVTRIGLCSTPMFNVNMGVVEGRFDLGVMVTASHNPSEYNGFKLIRGDMTPIAQGMGMEAVRDRFLSGEDIAPAKKQGRVGDDPNALARYLDRVCALADPSKIPALTVVADAGNGMNGVVLPAFIARLPQVTFHRLFWEPDGTFPNHEANPLKTETLKDLSAAVVKHRAALGVAYDGDADRIGIVDERGTPIPGDLLTALYAEIALAAHPGATILYDIRSSWAVPEAIRAAGGNPVMTKVGHTNIKRHMKETGAFFAGELSMHFYFSELWNMESGELALLRLLSSLTGPLSARWESLRKYAKTGEINTEVADRDATLARVQQAYASSASSVSTLDGIRMEFQQDWWFSLRTSNTEPVVRLIVEATTPELMAEKRDELLALIQGGRAA